MINIEILFFKGLIFLLCFDDFLIFVYVLFIIVFVLLYINELYFIFLKISRKNGINMNYFIDFFLECFLLFFVFCFNLEFIFICFFFFLLSIM